MRGVRETRRGRHVTETSTQSEGTKTRAEARFASKPRNPRRSMESGVHLSPSSRRSWGRRDVARLLASVGVRRRSGLCFAKARGSMRAGRSSAESASRRLPPARCGIWAARATLPPVLASAERIVPRCGRITEHVQGARPARSMEGGVTGWRRAEVRARSCRASAPEFGTQKASKAASQKACGGPGLSVPPAKLGAVGLACVARVRPS